MTFNNDIRTTGTCTLSLANCQTQNNKKEEKKNEMAEHIAWIDSEMSILDPLEWF